MAATKQEISQWFDEGVKQGATHMIVVCDTYDHEDYPVYVLSGQDAKEKANRCASENMQCVMECYNLTLDKQTQLAERRSQHYEQV